MLTPLNSFTTAKRDLVHSGTIYLTSIPAFLDHYRGWDLVI